MTSVNYKPIVKGEWEHQPGDQYKVTGFDCEGKRVSLTFNNWPSANGTNIYKGNKWLIRNHRRHLIQRVHN
jgi:hypothetical protein